MMSNCNKDSALRRVNSWYGNLVHEAGVILQTIPGMWIQVLLYKSTG